MLLVVCRPLPSNHFIPIEKPFLFYLLIPQQNVIEALHQLSGNTLSLSMPEVETLPGFLSFSIHAGGVNTAWIPFLIHAGSVNTAWIPFLFFLSYSRTAKLVRCGKTLLYHTTGTFTTWQLSTQLREQ